MSVLRPHSLLKNLSVKEVQYLIILLNMCPGKQNRSGGGSSKSDDFHLTMLSLNRRDKYRVKLNLVMLHHEISIL